MWDSEQKFSHYLTDRLKKEGFVCNRIETHGTLNGMPDLFVQGNGMDTFIELKNMKKASVNDKQWKVPWRPGQVAWATVYRNTHWHSNKDYDIIKCPWTFIGCKDGIIALPMCSNFTCSEVNALDIKYIIKKDDSIKDILMAHSQLVIPYTCPGEWSMHDFIYGIARNYQYMFAGTAESYIDWPDTEIIAQSIDMCTKEFSGRAPAGFQECKVLSAKIASVIYSCYDNYLLNK